MNYAAIKKHDIANGPGVRVSLFVSGCTHHCEGCFNPETWDFQYGTPYTAETELEILEALEPDYIRGLSLLGGEPLEPEHQAALLPLLRRFSRLYPDKTIWCYTGYDFELDLLTGRVGDWSVTQEFLSLCSDQLWVQVYSGEKLQRQGLAVEPMSCPPNAFNSGIDLLLLESGKPHRLFFNIYGQRK